MSHIQLFCQNGQNNYGFWHNGGDDNEIMKDEKMSDPKWEQNLGPPGPEGNHYNLIDCFVCN